ncbi:MAG TPA: glycine zipper 2TM domain-containing protein [Vicinamibacterales bacterium]
MNRLRTAVIAALMLSFTGLQPATALAGGRDDRPRHRYEDRWDRHHRKHHRKIHKAHRKAVRRSSHWDPARYYRYDPHRYRPRRLGRHDRIYRGYDNRYYCKRDDGTTGLIVGGITGGVLGHVIAPGGSKTLGTILGASAGALIGRAIDDGDIVCH